MSNYDDLPPLNPPFISYGTVDVGTNVSVRAFLRPQRWECQSRDIPEYKFNLDMVVAGNECWEPYHIERISTALFRVYFKRPVEE